MIPYRMKNLMNGRKNICSDFMKRVVMIHGWGGYPEEGWRPWLKNKLQEKNVEVHIPEMPDTENPKMNEWLDKLKETIGKRKNVDGRF